MTVSELITKLQTYDPKLDVRISLQTEVGIALRVAGNTETTQVKLDQEFELDAAIRKINPRRSILLTAGACD